MKIRDILQIKCSMIPNDLVLLSMEAMMTYMASRFAICVWTPSLMWIPTTKNTDPSLLFMSYPKCPFPSSQFRCCKIECVLLLQRDSLCTQLLCGLNVSMKNPQSRSCNHVLKASLHEWKCVSFCCRAWPGHGHCARAFKLMEGLFVLERICQKFP